MSLHVSIETTLQWNPIPNEDTPQSLLDSWLTGVPLSSPQHRTLPPGLGNVESHGCWERWHWKVKEGFFPAPYKEVGNRDWIWVPSTKPVVLFCPYWDSTKGSSEHVTVDTRTLNRYRHSSCSFPSEDWDPRSTIHTPCLGGRLLDWLTSIPCLGSVPVFSVEWLGSDVLGQRSPGSRRVTVYSISLRLKIRHVQNICE